MKQQNSFAIKLIVIVVFCEANIKKKRLVNMIN